MNCPNNNRLDEKTNEEQSPVFLRIYDLTNGFARQFSSLLTGIQIDGIWHTGIEVYGKEYYFHSELRVDEIGQFKMAQLVDRVFMGNTMKTEEELLGFIEENKEKWNENTYHPLDNNCNHFTNKLALFLIEKQIPQFILDLPELAKSSPQIKAMFEKK